MGRSGHKAGGVEMTRVSIMYIVGKDGPCFWFISDDEIDPPDLGSNELAQPPALGVQTSPPDRPGGRQDVDPGPLDPDIDPC
jgi:hypothetical protein